MTAANRYAMAGRIGAHSRWGKTIDRAAATEAARRAFDDRFLREVLEEFPDLKHEIAAKLAESRRKAYFAKLAQKSVAARARKRARTSNSSRRAA